MASDEEDEIQLLEDEPGILKKKRVNYTVEYKLEAIEWGIKYSLISVAKKFTKGNRARIRDWTKQRVKLQRQVDTSSNGSKHKRIKGGGRTCCMKCSMIDWRTGLETSNRTSFRSRAESSETVIGGCGQFKKKCLLVWDAFGCHKSEATTKVLNELEIKTAIIPGGCTKFIQAPDVSWNKPLKEKIRHRSNLWMINDANKEFTAAGNPKALPLEIVLGWVCDAWEELEKEMIIKSFKACALSTALDGSEDNKIHCFQPDGPIGTQGQDLLREFRAIAEG